VRRLSVGVGEGRRRCHPWPTMILGSHRRVIQYNRVPLRFVYVEALIEGFPPSPDSSGIISS
jgi:hypothetical protein